MCGIAGVISAKHGLDALSINGTRSALNSMLESLQHRGPDGIKTKLVESRDVLAGLGHARLAIIDPLARSDQPMESVDGKVTIVFNGEIYNFRSLREKLQSAGHIFRTESDSEVVLNGYLEWGAEVFGLLDGMFAIVILDERRAELLMARDRLGIKPLFFARPRPKSLIFASEPKALFRSALVAQRINLAQIPFYFRFGYVRADDGFWSGVTSLAPGDLLRMSLSNGEIAVDSKNSLSNWLKHEEPFDGDERAVRERIRGTLEEAVRDCLISDRPVGIFLSGGVDSSLVAAMAARHRPDLQAFTLGFDDKSFDESEFATAIASEIGIRHSIVPFTSVNLVKLSADFSESFDEPIADLGIWPLMALSHSSTNQVKVVLTGDGGDELFFGYTKYKAVRAFAERPWLKSIVSRIPDHLLMRFLPGEQHNIEAKLAKLKGLAASAENESLGVEASAMHSLRALEALLSPEMASVARRPEKFRAGAAGPVDDLNLWDFDRTLPDCFLVKADRATMRYGQEGRVPFLHDQVVKAALTLPTAMRFAGYETKPILKAILREYLPSRVLDNRKRGLAFSERSLLAGSLKEEFADLTGDAPRSGIFSPHSVEKLRSRVLAGDFSDVRLAWSVFIFEKWRRRWARNASFSVPTAPGT